MQLQLDFFKPISEEIDLSNKANNLLSALNDGRKKSELYEPAYYKQVNDLVILIAQNKQKDTLFNIINLEGTTPSGFSACWRIALHIRQELLEYLT